MTKELERHHIDFLRDVRSHVMTIEMDQGSHRSIHFGRPGSSVYHFRLNTWPGHLAISGDMGSFVFARTSDMFEFFRDENMTGSINPGYWHEKLQAQDKHGGAKRFSQERMASAVRDHAADWEVRLGDAAKIQGEVDELADGEFSNEHEASEAIRDFESSNGHHFYDFEPDLRDWDHGFLWCLRAIVWGIKRYDLVKERRTQADHDRRVLGLTAPVLEGENFHLAATAMTIQQRGALAIYAGPKTQVMPDGTRRIGMNAPMLIMPPQVFSEPRSIMERVAKILNANDTAFFGAGETAQSAHDRQVLSGAL